MRLLRSLLASTALMGLTLAAHATTDTTFTVTNGTTTGNGTFSGSYSLNKSSDAIDSGSFTFVEAGNSEVFTYVASNSGPGIAEAIFTNGKDALSLDTTGSTTAPALCTVTSSCYGSAGDFSISSWKANYAITGGTIAVSSPPVAATPEPSSLILLGTGILGVAGAARRRLLNR